MKAPKHLKPETAEWFNNVVLDFELQYFQPIHRTLPKTPNDLRSYFGPILTVGGLKKDKETAVFMVDATAEVDGDGHCAPSPTDCQTLTMKAGDVEFIDTASGKQFELDLLKVHTSTTTDASAAEAARAAEAKGGRSYLRRNAARLGRYRYSSASGLLSLLPQATWKREAAQAARAKAARELTATSDVAAP